MSNGPRKRNVHRKLKAGQVPAIGQVVYADVNGDEWVIEGPEGEAIRRAMRHSCPECSAAGDEQTACARCGVVDYANTRGPLPSTGELVCFSCYLATGE